MGMRIKEDNKKLRQECKTLRRDLREADEETDKLCQDLQEANKEMDKLRWDLQEADEEMDKLRRDLQEANEEMDELGVNLGINRMELWNFKMKEYEKRKQESFEKEMEEMQESFHSRFEKEMEGRKALCRRENEKRMKDFESSVQTVITNPNTIGRQYRAFLEKGGCGELYFHNLSQKIMKGEKILEECEEERADDQPDQPDQVAGQGEGQPGQIGGGDRDAVHHLITALLASGVGQLSQPDQRDQAGAGLSAAPVPGQAGLPAGVQAPGADQARVAVRQHQGGKQQQEEGGYQPIRPPAIK